MKLSELRVCDGCGGPLLRPPEIQVHVVRVTSGIVVPTACNQVLGLARIYHGALKLAEAMAPDPEVVKLIGDQEGATWDELLLCFACFCSKKSLAELVEARQARLDAAPVGEPA